MAQEALSPQLPRLRGGLLPARHHRCLGAGCGGGARGVQEPLLLHTHLPLLRSPSPPSPSGSLRAISALIWPLSAWSPPILPSSAPLLFLRLLESPCPSLLRSLPQTLTSAPPSPSRPGTAAAERREAAAHGAGTGGAETGGAAAGPAPAGARGGAEPAVAQPRSVGGSGGLAEAWAGRGASGQSGRCQRPTSPIHPIASFGSAS